MLHWKVCASYFYRIILCMFCPIYDMVFYSTFLYTNDNKVVGTKNKSILLGRSISYGRKNIPEVV